MNVIPLKFDCQQEHTIQRAASPEPDEVDQAVAALTSAAGKIYELALLPGHRDRMMAELGPVCEAALAMNLVVSMIEARMVANVEVG